MSTNFFGPLSSQPVTPPEWGMYGDTGYPAAPNPFSAMPGVVSRQGAARDFFGNQSLGGPMSARADMLPPGMVMDEYGGAPAEQSEWWNDPSLMRWLGGGLGAAAGWMDASNYNRRQKAWGDKKKSVAAKYGLAQGGQVGCGCAEGGLSRYVAGGSKGQDDKVPAMLSDGEYVFDADTVAALGDGNNAAGASALDKMRENIRRHKRKASPKKIPPKAKTPEQYLKKGVK